MSIGVFNNNNKNKIFIIKLIQKKMDTKKI